MLLQILQVRIAGQKPQQFINDRLHMQLLRCDQGKAFIERKPHLMSEHRQRPSSRAVAFLDPAAEDEFHQIKILAHLPDYRLATRRWGSLSRGATAGSAFSTVQMPALALDSCYNRSASSWGFAMSFDRILVAGYSSHS